MLHRNPRRVDCPSDQNQKTVDSYDGWTSKNLEYIIDSIIIWAKGSRPEKVYASIYNNRKLVAYRTASCIESSQGIYGGVRGANTKFIITKRNNGIIRFPYEFVDGEIGDWTDGN